MSAKRKRDENNTTEERVSKKVRFNDDIPEKYIKPVHTKDFTLEATIRMAFECVMADNGERVLNTPLGLDRDAVGIGSPTPLDKRSLVEQREYRALQHYSELATFAEERMKESAFILANSRYCRRAAAQEAGSPESETATDI